jgi:multidrug efflux pump subunit AcrB
MENNINNHDETQDKFSNQAIYKTADSWLGFFITHFRVVVLIVSAVVLLGLIATVSIPREADPEVKIPFAVVTTVYPGASPSDIEDLVTDKIEDKLEELDHVKLITSSSLTSLSSVTIEFEAEANLEDSIAELREKVGEVNNLPGDAEDPFVTEIRANDFPIITFSLVGDLTDGQLKQLGEIVQGELESISGVSKVPLLGARQIEYAVIVDRVDLSRNNLTLNQVVGSIRAANMDMPLGDIVIDDLNYNLRTVGKFVSIDDLKQVVVGNVNDVPLLLEDIADVNEQWQERSHISRMSIAGSEPVNIVSLQIFKKTGGNILNIVDSAKEKLAMLQEEKIIPQNVQVEISSDYSEFIRDDLNTLGTSGIQAAILIFIIMFIALSLKEALVSFFSIPMVFLITMIVLYHAGYTINSMTLFAMVLSLGLLVDTFIVILEGIFHNIRAGWSTGKAALLSVAHYKKPLTAGVLTTISAFVPMLLVSGILGEYLKIFPITIAIILFSSLFVSLVFVPAISRVILKKGSLKDKHSILERYLTNRLRKWYRQKVRAFLLKRKSKVKLTIAMVVLFFISLGLLISGIIPVALFPKMDINFSYVNIRMPAGTALEATSEVAEKIEDRLYNKPYIKNFVTTIGQSSSMDSFSGGSNREHLANINITLFDSEERDLKSYEIVEELRKELIDINEGEITIVEMSSGPPTGAPIEARITGDDLLVIGQLTEQVVDILENTEGVINVTSDQQASPADLTFTLKKDVLSKVGLTVGEVSSTLRTAIFGVTATEISASGDDIDVVVKFDKEKISSIEEIKNLSIINNFGQGVKLSYVADFSLEPALSTIRHRDFERTNSIRADLEPGFTPTVVVPLVEEAVIASGIPQGYIVSFGGEVEDIEQSFAELWNAMIVAVLLILIILVLQFNSFRRTINILMTLPLMLIGVVVGMLVLGLPFSFAVFMGLISLAGIVVNDAIVLVDKANRNIKEKNMQAVDAIADAGDSRLQPILLTSITTIVGVTPLAFANEFWVGLSVAIIFGLAFATVLQLFVIPMIFVKFEGKKIAKLLQKS